MKKLCLVTLMCGFYQVNLASEVRTKAFDEIDPIKKQKLRTHIFSYNIENNQATAGTLTIISEPPTEYRSVAIKERDLPILVYLATYAGQGRITEQDLYEQFRKGGYFQQFGLNY